MPHEFVLYSNHETLIYLNSQKKLNPRYAKWVEYIQAYTFVLKHRARNENKVADALSRRSLILNTIKTEVLGFDQIKEEYESCLDFKDIYQDLIQGPVGNGVLNPIV